MSSCYSSDDLRDPGRCCTSELVNHVVFDFKRKARSNSLVLYFLQFEQEHLLFRQYGICTNTFQDSRQIDQICLVTVTLSVDVSSLPVSAASRFLACGEFGPERK